MKTTKNRVGTQSLVFNSAPIIRAGASIVGKAEGNGSIGNYFDIVLTDDLWGEDTWEKAERKMFEQSVRIACKKAGIAPDTQLGCLLGGDLLNQLISVNFAARALKSPFLGLYGACSTMAESLLIGSMLVDGGYSQSCACVAGSHFSTAERQYRFPLELGGQKPPGAQRTVTGVGCAIVKPSENDAEMPDTYSSIHITGATIGTVVDMGITDANNMGAAMAPAAAHTIATALSDHNLTPEDFDLIITGDLGTVGTNLLKDLLCSREIDLKNKHLDCGNVIFAQKQDVGCGGSGCGCSAVTLCGYLLKRMEAGDFKKALFLATGALLSPTTDLQGDTIPGIAHAVILERRQR